MAEQVRAATSGNPSQEFRKHMNRNTDASSANVYSLMSDGAQLGDVLAFAAMLESARHAYRGVGDSASASSKTEPCAAYVMSGAFAPAPAGVL